MVLARDAGDGILLDEVRGARASAAPWDDMRECAYVRLWLGVFEVFYSDGAAGDGGG